MIRVVLQLLCGLLCILYEGWVLKVVWAWFLVPQLHVPSLNVPSAIGISMIASMMTHQTDHSEESRSKDAGVRVIAKGFVIGTIVLITGFFVRMFM
jgi:hypothetical protein